MNEYEGRVIFMSLLLLKERCVEREKKKKEGGDACCSPFISGERTERSGAEWM